MKNYEIITTRMVTIKVSADTEEAAIKIARTQFAEGEEVMMVSSKEDLY